MKLCDEMKPAAKAVTNKIIDLLNESGLDIGEQLIVLEVLFVGTLAVLPHKEIDFTESHAHKAIEFAFQHARELVREN